MKDLVDRIQRGVWRPPEASPILSPRDYRQSLRHTGRVPRSGPVETATPRQREYLEFIAKFFAENDQLPPIAVLAAHFECCPNAAMDNVKALERKCYLEKNEVGKYKRGRRFGEIACRA